MEPTTLPAELMALAVLAVSAQGAARVQVAHPGGSGPEKGMADSVGGVGEPYHLPAVVDRVGLAGGPAEGADVGDGNRAAAGIKKDGVISAAEVAE